jgi:hypothetical protein
MMKGDHHSQAFIIKNLAANYMPWSHFLLTLETTHFQSIESIFLSNKVYYYFKKYTRQ